MNEISDESVSLLGSTTSDVETPRRNNARNKFAAVATVAILALVSALVAYNSYGSSATTAIKGTELKITSNPSVNSEVIAKPPLKKSGIVTKPATPAKSSWKKAEKLYTKSAAGIDIKDIERAADIRRDHFTTGKIDLMYREDERLLTLPGALSAAKEQAKEHKMLNLQTNVQGAVATGAAVAGAAAVTYAGAAIGANAGLGVVGITAGIIAASGGTAIPAAAVAGIVASGVLAGAAVAAVGVVAAASLVYLANGGLCLLLHPAICTYQTYGRKFTWAVADCQPGYSKVGLLQQCMPSCKNGYSPGVLDPQNCYANCPSGYTDTGLNCAYNQPLTANAQCNNPSYPTFFLGKCYANGVDTRNLAPLAQLNPCPSNTNDVLGSCWTISGCNSNWDGCCWNCWGCCGCWRVNCLPPSYVQVWAWNRGYQNCRQGYSLNGILCTANSIDPSCPAGYSLGLLNICGLIPPSLPVAADGTAFTGLIKTLPLKPMYTRLDLSTATPKICPSGQDYLDISNWAVVPGCYAGCNAGDMPDPKGAINCILAQCPDGYKDCASLIGIDLGGLLGQRSCGVTKDDCVKVQFTGNQNLLAGFAACNALPKSVSFTLPPSAAPSFVPTALPTAQPTIAYPSPNPTQAPTNAPIANPTTNPTLAPTTAPTNAPIANPTTKPTAGPTYAPTPVPSAAPTVNPTLAPSTLPTLAPTPPLPQYFGAGSMYQTGSTSSGGLNFLDRQSVACTNTNFPLNGFQGYNDNWNNFNYKYWCAQTAQSPTSTYTVSTSWQAQGDEELIFLDRNPVSCQAKTDFIAGFSMQTQYNPNNYKYTYTCNSYANQNFQCQAYSTNPNSEGNNIIYLDRQQVQCPSNQALQSFSVKNDGGGLINYFFTCCTMLPLPTSYPISNPTLAPTFSPTNAPVANPTKAPIANPTSAPIANPTSAPIANPTLKPTYKPSALPTQKPSPVPSAEPTYEPSAYPTPEPTFEPTFQPTANPTPFPTLKPIADPTFFPTPEPSFAPTNPPIPDPTPLPSAAPIANPTFEPTAVPTVWPSFAPTPEPTLLMKYQKVNGNLALCTGTWQLGKDKELKIPAGCSILATNALEEMVPGGTSFIVHVCLKAAAGPLKISQNDLTQMGFIENGKSTISTIYPGEAVSIQFFDGANFNGDSTTYTTYDGSLVHKVYPGKPVVNANDNVNSVIFTSDTNADLPTNCAHLQ